MIIEQIEKHVVTFRAFVGDEVKNYTTQLSWGLLKINHEIRIPSLNNQDSMESKAGFFRGSNVFFWFLLPQRRLSPKVGPSFFSGHF